VHRRFATLLWLSTQAQAPLLALALLLAAAQMVLGLFYPAMDLPAGSALLLVLTSTLLMAALVLVAYLFMQMALNERPRHPTAELLRRIRGVLRDVRAMALGLPVFASLVVFIYAFSNLKGNIPVFQPFAWDATLDRWDMVLHFGRRPWEWLHPLLGHWPVTFILNVLYSLWFVVMFSIWLHYAFLSGHGVARTRFFVAFMLLWMIGGGLFAVLFSSTGPCFYGAGHLGIMPDPYAGLMAYLHRANEAVPIWAVRVQEELWRLHAEGSAEASVSAMPSMHNGSALLFALASGGWPVWIRRFLWAYVVVIFVGSVHLAYHYAVDGYAGWALALAVWWLAGWLARRWDATAAAARLRSAFAESPASL
jgi:hypothetical protein